MPSNQGLRCHALRVRLQCPADQRAIARLLGSDARLWAADLPFAHDHDLAERRREAELSRPVPESAGESSPVVRAVLLRYADAVADLILSARRADLDYRMLSALTARVTGREKAGFPGRPITGPVAWQEQPSIPRPDCDWGLGDGGDYGRIAWCESPAASLDDRLDGGEPAGWVAALALTLSRYDDSSEPVLAVVGHCGGVKLVRAQVRQTATLGDLIASARAILSGAPDAAVTEAAPPWSGAGLLFTFASADYEYRPFLEPPFPLTLVVTLIGDGTARFLCRYRPSVVARELAGQFTSHLLLARRQVLELPRQRVSATELFGPAGKSYVVAPGQPAGPPGPETGTIHQRFSVVAGKRPEQVALSSATGPVSYGELDRSSGCLARGLVALGIGRGDRVGVCLERTPELIQAVLAVLKAGAAYVPLDPAYPVSRLELMIGDAAAAVVITAREDLPGSRTVTAGELKSLGGTGSALPPDTAGSADPAYIIFTSGSTGRPKGVVVPHGNVTSLIDATAGDFALGAGDTWTLFHSFAFDFSVWEIWGCLLTGGRLVIVPYWESRSPDSFGDLLSTERVTVLSQTPSAFAQLIEADRGRPGKLDVRLVVLGGEALSARVLLPWLDRYPESRCAVVNMFGITETTVHVTAETTTRRHALSRSRSVGRPLRGWQVYILDSMGRLAPPGVRGEIYVAGAGVAQCYLNRPDLTSERFVADPFSSSASDGRRMYRSGDRGRMRPDGVLEYHGRADNQIKLRGFRIEPAEIRAALLECPMVTDAAVARHHDDLIGDAADRLDAYVVLCGGTTEEVREHAARLLPAHMVPATVTALPALPLTANGKLDTARLPAPRLGTSAGAAAPAESKADQVAWRLATLWTDVLGTPVDLDDNFFDLGGNSLLAVQVTGTMRERGWPSLPLRELYRHPTVRMLAELLSGAGPAAGSPENGEHLAGHSALAESVGMVRDAL
ncbi:MAG TPA: amino acid adenylation domain-containing protein [Streptosporangiaceae bacterium]|nr:amino acid adenylation domain-containing protein [Streptosporangiaceae bacterium]